MKLDYMSISFKLERLEKCFDKTYNAVQRNEITKNCDDLTTEQFDELIDLAIKEYCFLPKIAEIIKLKEKVTPSAKKQEEKKFERVDCPICGSSGLIEQFHKINGIEYGGFYARCCCKNAEQWKEQKGITPFEVTKQYKDYIKNNKELENKKVS